MCPHGPDAASTISIRARWPRRSFTSQLCGSQAFVVLAGGGAGDLAAHEQVDAGLLRLAAAADQETQEGPFEGELGGEEPAMRLVPAEEGVYQALALKTADRLLIGQRARGGLRDRTPRLRWSTRRSRRLRSRRTPPAAGPAAGRRTASAPRLTPTRPASRISVAVRCKRRRRPARCGSPRRSRASPPG